MTMSVRPDDTFFAGLLWAIPLGLLLWTLLVVLALWVTR